MSGDHLREEAIYFARYLIGERPPEIIIERYGHAVARLFGTAESSAALRLARRNRYLLPLLDAACGLRRPDDPLRRRLLVMAAVLETTPEYAERFLPRHAGHISLFVQLAMNGFVAALNVLAGLPLLLFLPPERKTR